MPQPRQEVGVMMRIRPIRILGASAVVATMAAVAVGVISTNAEAGSRAPGFRLASTAFAAEVGSLRDGGSVYAGALVDPRLHHGAIVVTAHGTSTLRVTFQEFFARGSLKGDGRLALSQTPDGESLSGRLSITSGTGAYAGAHGCLHVTGTVDGSGQIVAVFRGAYRR
jgi:hypothetical protein